jgi:hypothetical protein
MHVYARTTITRELLSDGQLAFVSGAPTRKDFQGPWVFIGTARTFADANALTRIQAERDRRTSYEQKLAAGYTYNLVASSVYQASVFAGTGGAYGEKLGPDDPPSPNLQWYEYTAGGPNDGWSKV